MRDFISYERFLICLLCEQLVVPLYSSYLNFHSRNFHYTLIQPFIINSYLYFYYSSYLYFIVKFNVYVY